MSYAALTASGSDYPYQSGATNPKRRARRVVWCALAVMAAATRMATAGEPLALIGYGTKLMRVHPSGVIETFSNQPGENTAMTVVPAGVSTSNYQAGDVLALEFGRNNNRVWRVDNPWHGTPAVTQIGTLVSGVSYADLDFANGRLYAINTNFISELHLETFAPLAVVDVRSQGGISAGGLAFDGNATWYFTDSNNNRLFGAAHPLAADGAVRLDNGLGLTFGTSDLNWLNGQLWGALRQVDGAGGFNILLGTFTTTSGSAAFTTRQTIFAGNNTQVTGLALRCASDFNGDLVADLFDYLDYVAAFAGNTTTADFNADTVIDFFDYLDFVEAFSTGC